MGLLPGFVAAAVIGPLLGEIVYDISWGIMVPPLGELWQKASPLAIGWPSPKIFLECLPLALIGYIILFGDLVTGLELTREAQSARSDEKLEFNTTRTHYSTGIRNALSAIVAPFFPSQGILFSGPQVVVLQEWRRGRESMDSLFDGLSSYWLLGPPILYLFLPVVTFIKPLMPVALTLALLISGFAVAYVAMAIPRTPAERGVAFVTGIALTVYEPWIGLLLGVVATFALVGKKEAVAESARRESQSLVVVDGVSESHDSGELFVPKALSGNASIASSVSRQDFSPIRVARFSSPSIRARTSSSCPLIHLSRSLFNVTD